MAHRERPLLGERLLQPLRIAQLRLPVLQRGAELLAQCILVLALPRPKPVFWGLNKRGIGQTRAVQGQEEFQNIDLSVVMCISAKASP